MKIILSPARIMRSVTPPEVAVTTPEFLSEALELSLILREFSPWELESILKTNPKLALQASESYWNFSTNQGGTPAIFTYNGLVFQNLDPGSFSLEDLAFANIHLRVLSALYGILRPCDGILPYRLELVSRLLVNGKNLYQYWGDKIYRSLNLLEGPVINLCSGEFTKAVSPFLQPEDTFVTCQFLENRRGKLANSVVGIKCARGKMARYLIQNRVDSLEGVQSFQWEGYAFAPELSTHSQYLFVR